jgi:hypothetical protein
VVGNVISNERQRDCPGIFMLPLAHRSWTIGRSRAARSGGRGSRPAACRATLFRQICDEVPPSVPVEHADRHPRVGDHSMWVGEPTVQRAIVPDEPGASQRGRIAVSVDGGRSAPHHSLERRPNALSIEGMAGRTPFGEEPLTAAGIRQRIGFETCEILGIVRRSRGKEGIGERDRIDVAGIAVLRHRRVDETDLNVWALYLPVGVGPGGIT